LEEREKGSLKQTNIHKKKRFVNVASMNESLFGLLEDILEMKNLWTLKISQETETETIHVDRVSQLVYCVSVRALYQALLNDYLLLRIDVQMAKQTVGRV
jgi:hypothetical protein